MLKKIHHVAIICKDYDRSKDFYKRILGLEVIREEYRKDRQSFKLDLALGGEYIIELFSFPNPPSRLSHPEGTGLRHLAFSVENVDDARDQLLANGVACESIRIDTMTQKRFMFFEDPDGLPLELYES